MMTKKETKEASRAENKRAQNIRRGKGKKSSGGKKNKRQVFWIQLGKKVSEPKK